MCMCSQFHSGASITFCLSFLFLTFGNNSMHDSRAVEPWPYWTTQSTHTRHKDTASVLRSAQFTSVINEMLMLSVTQITPHCAWASPVPFFCCVFVCFLCVCVCVSLRRVFVSCDSLRGFRLWGVVRFKGTPPVWQHNISVCQTRNVFFYVWHNAWQRTR